MKNAKDPIFIIQNEGNIILVDDPELCKRLEARAAEMEAGGFDELAISRVLLQILKSEGYEQR